jgi:3-hydroxybutyryl-CoA dehydrogenase
MVSTILVIGSGTMGRGIAQTAATSGVRTFLYDSAGAQIRGALAEIEKSVAKLVEKQKLTAAQGEGLKKNLSVCESLGAVAWAEVGLVVEAIFENFDAKIALYRDLQGMLGKDTILATNTSSISITKLGAATDRSDRFIGMHFFNPVPLMSLVEVIRGLATSDATCETVEAVARQMGKTPMRVRDMPGFVSNRVLMPMINEAVFALMEGVADAPTIDQIMKLGCNFPMGPLTLADFIGVDVCLHILEVMHRDLGDPKFRPCPLLRQMVDAGRLGRKSGRGFYDYSKA